MMAYTITKEFHFSAAHQLNELPPEHKCARLHGHNYIVVVVLCSEILDQYGFVVDYGDLSVVKEYIDDVLDHRNLNDILETPTTAENIAAHIYHRFKSHFPQLKEVRVSETPKTWAIYSEVSK